VSRTSDSLASKPTISAFQQIEIEEAIEPKHGPTLRLFGVTQNGNSVLAHIHGFQPYFYIAAPSGFLNKDLEPFKDTINVSSVYYEH
jgi:DNA polymerase delta subunit 1